MEKTTYMWGLLKKKNNNNNNNKKTAAAVKGLLFSLMNCSVTKTAKCGLITIHILQYVK